MSPTRFLASIVLLAVLTGCDSGTDDPTLTGTWDTTGDLTIVNPDGTTTAGTGTQTYVLTQTGDDVRGTFRSTTRANGTETVSESSPVTGTVSGTAVSLITDAGGGRAITVSGTFSETEMRLLPPDSPVSAEPFVYRRR